MTVPHQKPADHAPAFEPGDADQLVRVPPRNLDAEQCVLGGMLLSKDEIGNAVEVVKGRDFYLPAHETIYRTIVDMWSQGEPADPITVAAELIKRGEIDRCGGRPYLHGLVNAVPTAANTEYYAEIVRDQAVLRRLTEAGTRIAQMGYAADGEVTDIVSAAEAEMLRAVDSRAETNSYSFISDVMEEMVDGLESPEADNGVKTGLSDLDSLTGGLQPGQMVIVAARPATGKSTLALDFARASAIGQGKTTVFFSLEMGKQEIAQRLASAECRIGLHHIKHRTMQDDDWTRMARRMPEISAAPLILDDSPNLTLMEIRSRARRIAQRHDLALMVVDYLQLVQSGTGKRYGNRQEEVAEISRQFKLLAKELQIPVIALSQLNRGPEQRTDKMPVMSDLRESGAIEQDADVVILLHREDVYEKESPRAGEADLIVCKHRNGPTGTITVAFQGHYSRFVDMADEV